MIFLFIALTIKLFFIFLVFLLLYILLTQLIHYKLKYLHKSTFKNIKTISFIHPFCSDCGGGEKVLWRMIASIISSNNLQTNQKLKINIISGRNDNVKDLIKKLKDRFGIELRSDYQNDNNYDDNNLSNDNSYNNNENFSSPINNNNALIEGIELISMRSGYMLRPQNFLTMFLQILGQIYFGLEIITKVYSDVYCDTTGLPFCYFVLKYLGHAKVSAYTHYPFISYDMIDQVEKNQSGVHSQGKLSKNKYVRKIKLFYYKLILKLYEIMGNKCLSFAYANSTWTFNHLNKLWRELYNNQKLFILYPPCSISLYKEAAKNDNRQNIIVSFAQFRPEKRQDLQILVLKELRDRLSKYGINDLELHIIGGVRNKSDQEILDGLVKYAQRLGVQDYVKFLPNGKTSEILEEFAQAKIGIHTMKYEHFGITLIEMMAAGLIIVTHNSAGAKDDILVYDEETNCKPGFLVETEEEYVNQIEEILVKYHEIRNQIINSSVKRAEKFSDDAFKKQFLEQFNDFLL